MIREKSPELSIEEVCSWLVVRISKRNFWQAIMILKTKKPLVRL